jgi:carbamoyl-phosphate synthase large subunit
MFNNILIIALNENWTGISRLPYGLDRAGFKVYALCPKKSFLAKTKFLKKSILYPTFTYSRSFLIYPWIIIAIVFFKPDLIIPGDEDAVLALQKLSNGFNKIPFLNFISKIIRKSLPSKLFDAVVLNKSDFQEKCRSWGLRTPRNIVLEKPGDAIGIASDLGYPVVLKHDSGYGGSGVFICHNEEDVKKQIELINNNTSSRRIKNILKNLFFVSIFNDGKISLQQYIEGQIGQSPFCAHNGKVFAFNPMVRLKTHPGKTGPATVSQGYENHDIEYFVKTIAEKLSYIGFGSLEYMVEKTSGNLYIIELNPRPTPTCHMSSDHVTNDLCEMFFKGLNSIPLELKPFIPYTIAMFPGEKKRNPESLYLKESYHDIPLNDPILLRALEQA